MSIFFDESDDDPDDFFGTVKPDEEDSFAAAETAIAPDDLPPWEATLPWEDPSPESRNEEIVVTSDEPEETDEPEEMPEDPVADNPPVQNDGHSDGRSDYFDEDDDFILFSEPDKKSSGKSNRSADKDDDLSYIGRPQNKPPVRKTIHRDESDDDLFAFSEPDRNPPARNKDSRKEKSDLLDDDDLYDDILSSPWIKNI